jgi:hypothetical protein
LEFWSSQGREGEYLAVGFGGFIIKPTPTPPDGLPPYNPLLKTREDYLDRVRLDALREMSGQPLLKHGEASQAAALARSIAAAAESYCANVERQFESAGMIRTGERRALPVHREWAVKFQVMGQIQAEIAYETQLAGISDETTRKVGPQAVTKAVNIVLADIGLSNRLHHT